MIFHLFFAFCTGCVAHLSYAFTGKLPIGLSQIVAYTLGVIFAYPFVETVHDDLEDIDNPRQRLFCAYFLAYLAFGAGTALGWRVYPMSGPCVHIDDDPGLTNHGRGV